METTPINKDKPKDFIFIAIINTRKEATSFTFVKLIAKKTLAVNISGAINAANIRQV